MIPATAGPVSIPIRIASSWRVSHRWATAPGMSQPIRTARTGAMVIDPRVRGRLVPAPRKAAEADNDRLVAPLLTPREQEVLGLLGAGMDARAIARTLSISLHTCRGYVKSVLAKLDCHSQLEAVVAAGRLGLLPPPPVERR